MTNNFKILGAKDNCTDKAKLNFIPFTHTQTKTPKMALAVYCLFVVAYDYRGTRCNFNVTEKFSGRGQKCDEPLIFVETEL